MKFSVLGCGRWGSFLSWYISQRGFECKLWGRAGGASFETLRQHRANEYVKLSDNIRLTSDLAEAIQHADCLIVSISAQGLRTFIRELVTMHTLTDKTVLLCMKGLEEQGCKRLSEVCVEEGLSCDRVAVWLGPGHIQDFTRNIPNCMVIDSYNRNLTVELASTLNSELIRFYYGDDLIGNEIGAACKNIMGIAAGVLDGLGYASLKGPLMARGGLEVSRFIGAMGGNPATAYGLTHLGDYETTLFSPYSNNRKFGEQLARNLAFGKLAEGVATVKAVVLKARELNVEMPISQAIYNVIYENKDLRSELLDLFSRSQKFEKHN